MLDFTFFLWYCYCLDDRNMGDFSLMHYIPNTDDHSFSNTFSSVHVNIL